MVCQLHKNIYKKVHNNQWAGQNDPSKLSLRGYKNGEIGRNHTQTSQNGNSGMTLEEIAKQLGTSKTNLTRALRIERNLTDSMKELLDTGEITKTFVSDTIASLTEEQEELISKLDVTKKYTQKQIAKYIYEMKVNQEVIMAS